MNINATLRDWDLHYDFSAAQEWYYLSGRIYDDISTRFLNGTFIKTSVLKSIDFSEMIAITENSVYKLKDRESN